MNISQLRDLARPHAASIHHVLCSDEALRGFHAAHPAIPQADAANNALRADLHAEADGTAALRHNLSVGPPSLEQIAFSVQTASGSYDRPGLGVTVLSRVLDGPRRIWHNLT